MSRIRSIHPGIWTDDAFMSLTPFARLLFIGLWNEAWDDGVFEWKPLTLKARIFPVDSVDVPALLEELEKADCLVRYEGDKTIGVIRNFRLYQRPKKPNSSGLMPAELEQYAGLVRNQFGTSSENSPQMEDGGGRVEEGDRTSPPVSESEGARVSFEDVWEAFPQNPSSSISEARAVFERTKPADRADILKAAIRRARWFGQDCEARGRDVDEGLRYEPHLATWLKGKWRDSLALSIKGEGDPELAVVARGSPEFAALEKLRGHPIRVYGDGDTITVRKSELEQASAA